MINFRIWLIELSIPHSEAEGTYKLSGTIPPNFDLGFSSGNERCLFMMHYFKYFAKIMRISMTKKFYLHPKRINENQFLRFKWQTDGQNFNSNIVITAGCLMLETSFNSQGIIFIFNLFQILKV